MSTRLSTHCFGEGNGVSACSASRLKAAPYSNDVNLGEAPFCSDQRRVEISHRRIPLLSNGSRQFLTPQELNSRTVQYTKDKCDNTTYEGSSYDNFQYGDANYLERGYDAETTEYNSRVSTRGNEGVIVRSRVKNSASCAFCTLGLVALVVLMLASGAILFHTQQEQIASMREVLSMRSAGRQTIEWIDSKSFNNVEPENEGDDTKTLSNEDSILNSIGRGALQYRANRDSSTLDWSSIAHRHPRWMVGHSQREHASAKMAVLDRMYFKVDSFVFAARPMIEEWILWYESSHMSNRSSSHFFRSIKNRSLNRAIG